MCLQYSKGKCQNFERRRELGAGRDPKDSSATPSPGRWGPVEEGTRWGCVVVGVEGNSWSQKVVSLRVYDY